MKLFVFYFCLTWRIADLLYSRGRWEGKTFFLVKGATIQSNMKVFHRTSFTETAAFFDPVGVIHFAYVKRQYSFFSSSLSDD